MNGGKRVLVTGGAGFLGSNLCERLIDRGHSVVCLDNFLTGLPQNVAHLLDHPKFAVIQRDVVDPLPLDLEVDEIFNLACPASLVGCLADPIGTLKTAVLGALNTLEFARRRNIKILQASTSEVYGDPQTEAYLGNVNPIGPRACYDEGKRCAESLFFEFHRRWGLPIRIVRIFNTYGPRTPPNDCRVVPSFIVRALQNRPINLHGDGMQTRSFCYVDDMIDGFLAMMAAPEGVTGPINLGNPVETPIVDLAKLVIDLTGSRSSIERWPLPVDDPKQRRPDMSQAKSLLAWAPKVGLEAGLRRTIAYFDRLLAAEMAVFGTTK